MLPSWRTVTEPWRWRLRRLRSMPPGELPHRFVEQARRLRDRRRDGPATSLSAAILSRPVPVFPVDLPALRESCDADQLAALRCEADLILSGELELLGVAWPKGGRTDWHLDPVSGTRWPVDQRTVAIDFRHGHRGRDPKLVWELGRLQHLHVLALAAVLLEDQRAREVVCADLGSWLAANPPFVGIAYGSGIECAHRVVSLLLLAGLLGPQHVSGALREGVWRSLHAHAWWIDRYPSLYSSANNHRLAEVVARLVLGELSVELRSASHADLHRELRQLTDRLFHDDGVYAEQSPGYQAFTMEWLLVARRATATDLRLDDALVRGSRFLRALLDEAGGRPNIGDADDARVLRRSLGHEDPVPRILGTCAGLFGSPELAPPGWRHGPDAALLGASAVERRIVEPGSRHFPHGGYTVLRWHCDGRLVCLTMDHGPLGFAFTAGHGHADALSMWLHFGDRPVLVDSGTLAYTGRPAWRSWMRGTASHNTVTIDRRDQSEQAGPFNWAPVRAHAWPASVDLPHRRVVASHDGYRDLGITHTRQVDASDPGVIIVTDRLEGEGTHHVALRWFFAPDLVAEREGSNCRVGDDVRFELSVPGLDIALRRGGLQPGPGWQSPAYNQLEAAFCLEATGDLPLPAVLETRIVLGFVESVAPA